MALVTIKLNDLADYPVDAAMCPTREDVVCLLSNPRSYDPEGDEGDPALVIKGCFDARENILIWLADQCTHAQMNFQLNDSRGLGCGEFYFLVRPNYEVEFSPMDKAAQDSPPLQSLMKTLTRDFLRARLGRFPRLPSPRLDGPRAFR